MVGTRNRSTCYHPLLLFNREGDCLSARCSLATSTRRRLGRDAAPEIERQKKRGQTLVCRADAAFAKPEIYEAWEARGVNYAMRIPSNDSQERVAELLTRPVG